MHKPLNPLKPLISALLGLTLLGIVETGPALAAPAGAAAAPLRHVEADGVRYAYRALGPERGVPLVLVNRLRGTLDDWDPQLLDLLARERRVIVFDNVGMSRSSGTTPTTMAGFAQGAKRFIQALGLTEVDLLGFSIGGCVAQQLTLDEPALVRRLVVAGSGPGYVPGSKTEPKVWQVAGKPVNVDEDFLYLFFKDTPASQAAGRAYRERTRQWPDAHAVPVSETAWKAQIAAVGTIGTPETSLLNRLPGLHKPVLVANGDQDIMVPTFQSFEMFKVLPNAKLVLYPDSGHGFLFQHAQAFGAEVLAFLR